MNDHGDTPPEGTAGTRPSALHAGTTNEAGATNEAQATNHGDGADWTKVVIDGGTSVPPFDPDETDTDLGEVADEPPASLPAPPVETIVLGGSAGSDPFDPDGEAPS